jgi:hypothetical protein
MKPFNLEAANKGAPVVNRVGKVMKFVAHVPEARERERLVMLSPEGAMYVYYESGSYYGGAAGDDDLVMAPQKRTVWVNFYGFTNGTGYVSNTHNSEAGADFAAGPNSGRIGERAYPVEIDV